MNHGASGMVDLCLANSQAVPGWLLERYKQEDATPLVVDRERFTDMGMELVERPVASQDSNFARHSSDRLAREVLRIYQQKLQNN